MRITLKILKWFSYLVLLGAAGAAAVAFSIVLYLTPQLPDIEQLKDVQLQTPMRIYSQDNKLIAEFGEKRRTPVTYDQIPETFIQAILAAEDTSFYSHSGIDIKGLARAFVQLAQTGHIQSGGSTITMQVARNYLLTLDQTFTRKFKEILISLQMEQILSKQEIMELYVNKIYLGNRAYGIDAAAEVYYDKELHELSLAQLAMIAGLPKAPSRYNPIANPRRALLRRNWIIQRMYDLKMIDFATYDQAVREPITAKYHGLKPEVEAPYVAEMVRAQIAEQLGDEALYTAGYRVYTTIDSQAQAAANRALVNGLLAYDKRHGWRKDQVVNVPQVLTRGNTEMALITPSAEGELDLGLGWRNEASEGAVVGENISNWLKVLRETPKYGRLIPAIVTVAEAQTLQVVLGSGDYVEVPWETVTWAKPYHNPRWAGPSLKATSDILTRGDLIYVEKTESGFALSQLPDIQGAFVSIAPETGRLLALVGGFNFYQNKFNRAYQGGRQAGSIFKPFIYTAALENGFTAASIINDAPVVFDDKELESTWRPNNSSGKFYGPTRLRHALYKSRNLVSIRLLQAIGVKDAIQFASRFGFDPERLPKDLSLALGSATLSPFEMASAYAVIANGGFKVEPYFIARIESSTGERLFEALPPVVCRTCDPSVAEVVADGQVRPVAQRVVDERSVYIMHSMLKDVIVQGTAQGAKSLGRSDVAGKTGTTNDQKDAWFSGFNQEVVATAWVGFDQPETIAEYGSKAALPIWVDFMAEVLAEKPERSMAQPSGIVTVRIDPETGNRARPGQQNAIFEVFKVENVPQEVQVESLGSSVSRESIPGGVSVPVQEDAPAAEALF